MPIYEYKCNKCGKALEIMHKVSDPAPAKCPECQAEASLERLVSRSSFQLKGGGWYSDLYASAKKGEGSSSSGTSSSGSTSSTSSPSSTTSTSSAAPAPATSSGGGSSSGNTSSGGSGS